MFKVKIKKNLISEYLLNGFLHREDGPAVEIEGRHGADTSYWYKYGKLDRLDGPAAQFITGEELYYIKDVQYTYSEWLRIRQKHV